MKRKTTKTTKPTTHTTQPKAGKFDAQAEKVLNLLIAKLESGVNSWRKPWDCKGNPTDNADFFAVNLFTGKPYTGINAQSLPAGLYAGFSQITSHGGKVKKGSNAYPVAWFGSFEKDLEDEEEQQKVWEQFDANKAKLTSGKYGACYQIRIGFYGVYNVYLDENCDLEKVTCICKVMKFESVFRVEDTEGLEKYLDAWKKNHKPSTTEKPFNEIEAGDLWIEAYIKAANLKGFFYDGGNRSYYVPSLDEIHVSKRTNYHTPADFYSTAFHEMTHSTGHASRLGRVGITSSDGFGGERYAKEELIAEMGASMAMGFLGIETSGTLDNSAAYLASWLHQKVNEKASKKALETLMAASSSAKFAFAYIAEMYEAAKAAKEEENNQKKTEEPAPMPMLPAIIAPTASTASAAVFKAEPSERATLTNEAVCTPRGTFRIAAESKAELEAKGYGLWFEWTTPRKGQKFFIMHHTLTQTAVACEDESKRYLFCELPNATELYDFKKDRSVWKIFHDTCREYDNLEAWNELPEDFKEHARRIAKHWRDAKWDKIEEPFATFSPKNCDADEYGMKLSCSDRKNDVVELQKKDGIIVRYSLVCFLERFNIIKDGRACFRCMPNGEPCEVLPEAGQDARAEALSEFWVNIEDSTAVRVREGTGDNLDAEDVEAGYVDYIYYDTFDACDGLNIAERSENDENSDGGLILLEKPYKSYTTLEIATKVVDFIYGMVGSHSPDWKWSEEVPTFEEPDTEHYNDGMIDVRNITEFCMIVFTNCNGETKTIGYDDNFFAPIDLLKAYRELWRSGWNMDDEKEVYIKKFKEWNILCGCDPEELEEDE